MFFTGCRDCYDLIGGSWLPIFPFNLGLYGTIVIYPIVVTHIFVYVS